MKMLQVLVIVLIVSNVLVSPEPVKERWPQLIHIPTQETLIEYSKNVAIEYTPGTYSYRVRRRASVCQIPKSMEDAQLECKIYPSRVVCYQTCMFGYTLKEGIQRKMECNLDEDTWSPVNRFENCKPFVDCTLTLGPGGKFKCHSNFLDKGSHCNVSCEHFEDKPAVEMKTYVCDINGDWSPELPFCARPGTGIKLTSAPNGPKTVAEL